MSKIVLVGCGFLGSVFNTEFLKRSFAAKFPHALRYIDNDEVSDRNVANQNFTPTDIGRPKAEVLADAARQYGRTAEAIVGRLTEENRQDMLADAVLVIDCVDNLATRQQLWLSAHQTSVPVLHIGLSEGGTGRVEWSHPEHDTFGLSPARTVGKTITDPVSGVTPPCELARMRGAGLCIGFAGAIAASMFFGFDPEVFGGGDDTAGLATEWLSSTTEYVPRRELWSRI